jgi:hypothetical protein
MSGASITQATVPTTAIANYGDGFVTTTTTQTIGGTKTFTSTVNITNPTRFHIGNVTIPYRQYDTLSLRTTTDNSTADINWATTPPTAFCRNILIKKMEQDMVITLPPIASDSVFEGMEFKFRRVGLGTGETYTYPANNCKVSFLPSVDNGIILKNSISMMINNGSTLPTPAEGLTSANDITCTVICLNKTTTPYYWGVN